MNNDVLKEKEENWDNKITLEKYIKATEKDHFINCNWTDYEFYYLINNLKKLQEIKKIINNEKITGIEAKLMIKDILEGKE